MFFYAELKNSLKSSKRQLCTSSKSAKRKSVRGMRYSKEWILECLITRMKGPKLYEDMRRQLVLVLPTKVTVQK